MSKILIAAILQMCPGWDTNYLGQTVTTDCQEYMVNCMFNKAGGNEPKQKEFNECKSKYESRRERGS